MLETVNMLQIINGIGIILFMGRTYYLNTDSVHDKFVEHNLKVCTVPCL
jgi:hypothetical protein